MLTWKVRIAIIIVIIMALSMMINLIRKRSLELKYTLTWLGVGVSLLIVVIVPDWLNTLSDIIGVYNPVNMVFFLGFIFSLMLLFECTRSLSRNSNRVRKMAQNIALNEYQLKSMELQMNYKEKK